MVDIQLIADLHKSEVYKLGEFLGVPDEILRAAPSADLWEGQTDEEVRLFVFFSHFLGNGHYVRFY